MTLTDGLKATKDGESCHDPCRLDARCDIYAASICHLSMLDTAPFARVELLTAFKISRLSLVTNRLSGHCVNTRKNRLFACKRMLRCKYSILRKPFVRYFTPVRKLMMLFHTGATSCSSLNTSLVFGENATAARSPRMARTVSVLSV